MTSFTTPPYTMKYIYFTFITALFLSLVACEDDPQGGPIEVIYDTVPFDRIQLLTSADVRIIQANYYQVSLEGDQRDVNSTEVRVEDNWLIIEEHGSTFAGQVIEIFVPEIRVFESLGSSSVYGESQFRQNGNMDIYLTGSGEVDLYLDMDNIDVELSGSGDLYLEGLSDNLDIEITGSGWFNGFNHRTDFVDVRIEGSGSAEVIVDNDLDVIISGSGDVYYKGHPVISSLITGSGKLIDAN